MQRSSVWVSSGSQTLTGTFVFSFEITNTDITSFRVYYIIIFCTFHLKKFAELKIAAERKKAENLTAWKTKNELMI